MRDYWPYIASAISLIGSLLFAIFRNQLSKFGDKPDANEGAYGSKRVGLLLPKQGEAELISRNPYLLSHESFDNRLSKRNINALIEAFSQEGFFSHLTKAEVDSAKEKITTTDIGSIEDVLLNFPKTIVLFDWETGNLENPFEDLTRQFEAAARGSFKVTNITDEYKQGWNKAGKIWLYHEGKTL